MEGLKMFTEAQTAANRWLTEFHGRSQAALWEVLGLAYSVYRGAVNQPEMLEEAATALRVQVRKDAPNRVATIVLKIVFRPDPHHGLATAFAAWAKVLAWLEQKDIKPEHAARMIGDHGGVSGVSKLFNKENRKGKGSDLKTAATAKIAKAVEMFPRIGTVTKAGDGTMLTINSAKDGQTLSELAQQPGYVLLVARVDESFELSDLRVIDRDEEKISGIVASRSRAKKSSEAALPGNDNDAKKEAA